MTIGGNARPQAEGRLTSFVIHRVSRRVAVVDFLVLHRECIMRRLGQIPFTSRHFGGKDARARASEAECTLPLTSHHGSRVTGEMPRSPYG